MAEWFGPVPIDSDLWYVQRLDDTYRGNELNEFSFKSKTAGMVSSDFHSNRNLFGTCM